MKIVVIVVLVVLIAACSCGGNCPVTYTDGLICGRGKHMVCDTTGVGTTECKSTCYCADDE